MDFKRQPRRCLQWRRRTQVQPCLRLHSSRAQPLDHNRLAIHSLSCISHPCKSIWWSHSLGLRKSDFHTLQHQEDFLRQRIQRNQDFFGQTCSGNRCRNTRHHRHHQNNLCCTFCHPWIRHNICILSWCSWQGQERRQQGEDGRTCWILIVWKLQSIEFTTTRY